MHKRDHGNPELERAVRFGIVIDAELGSLSAWIFMAESGVTEFVTLRVLLENDKGREENKIALDISKMRGELLENLNADCSASFNLKYYGLEPTRCKF